MRIYCVVLIFIIILVIFSAFIFFVFYAGYSPHKKLFIENPINKTGIGNETTDKGTIEINEIHVTYLLNEIGAYELHNSPLSSNTPKIEIEVGSQLYNSKIVEGKILTKKGDIEDEDLLIKTDADEIINALTSGNVINYVKNSVADGKIIIETKANNAELFSKGYLSLYKKLTGKSLTGELIKIFRKS